MTFLRPDRSAGTAAAASPRPWWVRGLLACGLAGLLVAGIALPPVAGAGILFERTATSSGNGPDSLTGGRLQEATVVTDAAGNPIAHLYDRYRISVGSEAIADTMKAAIISIEDRRFFDHDGVDWYGLGRAVVSNAATGSPLEGQGASTITMQYVKNYRLYALAETAAQEQAAVEESVGRKISEVQLATLVEDSLDKDQILARYLDLVYFGNGAYGVEAAARTYFGTSAAQLTVPQAALLAGIVRAPSLYDPTSNPDNAQGRRTDVLRAMTDAGSITPAQAEEANAAPLGVITPLQRPDAGCAGATPGTGFFCQYVQDHLNEAGISTADLRTGGYTVRTTLDPAAQARATEAAEQVPTDTGVANVAAVVGPEPGSRPVRALAANRQFGGDSDQGQSALPLATAPFRGAGSVYKIFTAAAAMERGLVDPTSRLAVPGTYTAQTFTNNGVGYTVSNLGSPAGNMSLTEALATSPNTPFVALVDQLGTIDPVVDTARALGLRDSLEAPTAGGGTVGETVTAQQQASYTLGPSPTSPLELANVGATLVDDGNWCAPTPIVSVTDAEGQPVPMPAPVCERAIPSQLASDMRLALAESRNEGTAAGAASAVDWDRPMIAKTGTTQNSASAAFLGATEAYSGAVMTFSDQGAPQPVCVNPVRTCSDGGLTGGSVPASTWFELMEPLHENLPPGTLIPAGGPGGGLTTTPVTTGLTNGAPAGPGLTAPGLTGPGSPGGDTGGGGADDSDSDNDGDGNGDDGDGDDGDNGDDGDDDDDDDG